MIHGIGTDIVAIRRMDRIHVRYGERLADRLLAASERAEYAESRQPERFLAKRFAAKEAFAKAAGTGLRAPLTLAALAVVHDALGRPGFAFSSELAAWLAERGIVGAHLSIADEVDTVVAFAVLETGPCR